MINSTQPPHSHFAKSLNVHKWDDNTRGAIKMETKSEKLSMASSCNFSNRVKNKERNRRNTLLTAHVNHDPSRALFFTLPSRMPSTPKERVQRCSSTGPGSSNEIEKCPGGQRFRVHISKTWECLRTILSPVAVIPFMTTLPVGSISQLNVPAVTK